MTLRMTFEAHDVWFFRTSRPFGSADAGSSDGEPYLIPPPGVLYGAIRTALGNQHQVNWTEYREAWQRGNVSGWIERLGPPDPLPGHSWGNRVRLRGCLPVLVRKESSTPLFPVPAFVLEEKATKRRALALPDPETKGMTSAGDLDLALAMPPEDFEGKTLGGLLTADALMELLRGHGPQRLPEDGVVGLERLARGEPRVGIARNRERRTVQTGMLYTQTTHRWNARVSFREEQTFGLQVILDGVEAGELPSRLAVPLGGEGRLAWVRVQEEKQASWIRSDQNAAIRTALQRSQGWWLYLATPAVFEAGWHPRWIGEGLEARVGGRLLGKLASLVGEGPRPMSGWNLAGGCARPARLPMPAGTTYFFEWPKDGADAAVVDAVLGMQGTCVADELAHAGHGLAFVGAWNWEKSS